MKEIYRCNFGLIFLHDHTEKKQLNLSSGYTHYIGKVIKDVIPMSCDISLNRWRNIRDLDRR